MAIYGFGVGMAPVYGDMARGYIPVTFRSDERGFDPSCNCVLAFFKAFFVLLGSELFGRPPAAI